MIEQLSSGGWTLLDEQGNQAVAFTSFMGMDYRNEGEALSYPVEEGGFINYNKIQRPLGINVSLGVQGSEADYEHILLRLEEFRREAVKLSIGTPARMYTNMTLTGCSYSRKQDGGAGMLLLDLTLVEVREPGLLSGNVISSPKNPTSSSRVNIGKLQPLSEGALLGKARGLLDTASRKLEPLFRTVGAAIKKF